MRDYLSIVFLHWSFKLAQGKRKVIFAIHMKNLTEDLLKYEDL